ncbi:MAG: type VI secretion system tube protein Hcp [Candidatus Sulfotelmatobacter sp.]|jgi:type VI secretion system secreted protein Hcp
MASDAYLLIDGINGESQAQGMTNNIELDSFSFGASNPADVGGGGLSAGKCSLSDFSFTCAVDQASYQILKALYTGQHIATTTFSLRKSTGAATPYTYLSVVMTNCYLTSDSIGGGALGVPSMSVSVAYEQILYTYYTQNTQTGAVTQAGAATYNIGAVQQS